MKNIFNKILKINDYLTRNNNWWGDKFLRELLRLFKISFFIPLFGNGKSKLQPIFIDDVSLAINKIVEDTLLGNHIFEFVGAEIFTYLRNYIIIFCPA